MSAVTWSHSADIAAHRRQAAVDVIHRTASVNDCHSRQLSVHSSHIAQPLQAINSTTQSLTHSLTAY